jgi:hypothetical protein
MKEGVPINCVRRTPIVAFPLNERLCHNTHNLIDVMPSKAKHLAFSGSYKVEILRLRPQNDITTESPRGKELG